jgi:predicted RNA-binding Zn-ribbon protein involved in translation (DUF1610 family)
MEEKAMSEKKGKEKKMVDVCPVCGSSELYYETGGYVGKVYHCKDCNYVGALVVEADDEMIEAIKEEYKREIAFEIGMLGQYELNINDPKSSHVPRSLQERGL